MVHVGHGLAAKAYEAGDYYPPQAQAAPVPPHVNLYAYGAGLGPADHMLKSLGRSATSGQLVKRQCQQCSKTKKVVQSAKGVKLVTEESRSNIVCAACQVPLCLDRFIPYHEPHRDNFFPHLFQIPVFKIRHDLLPTLSDPTPSHGPDVPL